MSINAIRDLSFNVKKVQDFNLSDDPTFSQYKEAEEAKNEIDIAIKELLKINLYMSTRDIQRWQDESKEMYDELEKMKANMNK